MSAPFSIGQSVRVWKYGSWYYGRVVKVGRTRCEVAFTTKGGKPKQQLFAMDAPWSIKGA